MTTTPDVAKYRPLVVEAFRCFREDPEYVIAATKQAGTLLSNRSKPKTTRKLTKGTSSQQDS